MYLLVLSAIIISGCTELTANETSRTGTSSFKTTVDEAIASSTGAEISPSAHATTVQVNNPVYSSQTYPSVSKVHTRAETKPEHTPVPSGLLVRVNARTPQELYQDPQKQAQLIQFLIRQTFPQRYATMLAIAQCESSGLQHWTHTGELIPNSGGKSSAAGVMQVLLKLHGPRMRALQIDPQNPVEYMRFVRVLYDEGGLAPWNASRSCWAPRMAAN